MVFVLPADEVYEKDLLKSGFSQQSSVTSSSEPAGARPPLQAIFQSQGKMYIAVGVRVGVRSMNKPLVCFLCV